MKSLKKLVNRLVFGRPIVAGASVCILKLASLPGMPSVIREQFSACGELHRYPTVGRMCIITLPSGGIFATSKVQSIVEETYTHITFSTLNSVYTITKNK